MSAAWIISMTTSLLAALKGCLEIFIHITRLYADLAVNTVPSLRVSGVKGSFSCHCSRPKHRLWNLCMVEGHLMLRMV